MFGVSSSPFLLNATIDHQMGKFKVVDELFVDKFRRSIYVDDHATGFDVDSAYKFFIKSKTCLSKASFNLRKFDTNSLELRQTMSRHFIRRAITSPQARLRPR